MTQQEEHRTVFISYRREAAKYVALLVYKDLIANGYDAFIDIESIDNGQFDTIILRQIEARAHFVLILTPGTVERCVEPGDWLRREIEYAMETQRNIVPLLLNGFTFKDTEKYLTGNLSELSRFNGLPVPDAYFDEAMERLRKRYLKQVVLGEVKAAPASDHLEVERKIEAATEQPSPTKQELGAEEYFNKGMALDDNSDQEIAYYTELIRINPQYAAAYNNRGAVRKAQGDLDGAIADYTEAIRLNPQHAIAYYNRGAVRKAQGDLDGAMTDYDETIRLNPQSASAFISRGLLYYEQGKLDDAMTDYDEAIRLNSQDAEAYYDRAIARDEQGDFDGAIADYDEAIRLNPEHINAYYNRGVTRKNKDDLRGTIADYQKYLNLGGGQRDGDQAEVEQKIRELQAKLK